MHLLPILVRKKPPDLVIWNEKDKKGMLFEKDIIPYKRKILNRLKKTKQKVLKTLRLNSTICYCGFVKNNVISVLGRCFDHKKRYQEC